MQQRYKKNITKLLFFREVVIEMVNMPDKQGWVDYKSFVVRYNYSYFKNM